MKVQSASGPENATTSLFHRLPSLPVPADNVAMRLRRFQFRLRTLFVVMTILAIQYGVCIPAIKEWQHQRERETEERALSEVYLKLTSHSQEIVDDSQIN
jgi:hypothetical protein